MDGDSVFNATSERAHGAMNISPTFWEGRSVLVTGATGFLGGWLVRQLLHDGANVIVLLRDDSSRNLLSKERLLDRVVVVRGGLEDYSLLRRIIGEYGVQNVFHLAAQALVNVAKADPVGTLEANVRGTWHVLEAVRQRPSCQLVVASSDKAYGACHVLPYTESTQLNGTFPYDVSKSCADLISRMYAVTYGVPVCVTRCANIFGGGDFNFSRLLPDLIQKTLLGQTFVIRSDGKFVRDFIYAKDAVQAYLLLAERMASDSSLWGEAFNFSMGLRLTVLDLVKLVLRIMGRPDLEPIIENTASSEIHEQSLSAGKAHRVLGWAPQYTMERGLAETISWYRSHFAGESNVGQPEKAIALGVGQGD
jgi:CDP-glucose 4,6-dehydratase